jgi:hypothetical protein
VFLWAFPDYCTKKLGCSQAYQAGLGYILALAFARIKILILLVLSKISVYNLDFIEILS